MGASIDVYIDSVSPYSYFAVLHLLRSRNALASQGVDVNFHPVFLSGIMQNSGNKPPWTFAPRADYLTFDRARAEHYFDTPNMKKPPNFPVNTLNAQRALAYLQSNYPRAKFEDALLSCFRSVWELEEDLGKPEMVQRALGRVFSPSEVKTIMTAAGEAEWKQKLTQNTKAALDKGAYGNPWMWVRNKEGKEEPFFGSDRWPYLWEFLGLKWRDVALEDLGQSKL